jgi:hypothetical protein
MQLNEEACPVPESVLGQLYRATPHALTIARCVLLSAGAPGLNRTRYRSKLR